MATSVAWSELRRSLDLDEVENALGIEVVRVAEEDVASCPLPSHEGEDEHPSFSINNRTYAWNCFACGLGGPLFKLVQELMGYNYDQAIEWLRPYAGEYVEGDTKWLARIEKRLHEPMERPKMVRNPDLPYFPGTRISRWESLRGSTDYFKQRELGKETQRTFHLGYDPAYKGHKWTAPAVIIPHYFGGDIVGWQARALADVKPKYDNSDDFPKKDTLFGWDLAVQNPREPLVVVEGSFTVMTLWQWGMTSVGTFGSSISDRQIELLSTRTAPIWIASDNDKAGQDAAKRMAGILQNYVPVEIVPAPEEEKFNIGDVDLVTAGRLFDARKPSFLAFIG